MSIYTDNDFVSYDLDFIEALTSGRRNLKKALEEIGFKEKNRYFQHPETDFFLEFPTGPLAVGNEPPASVVEMSFNTGQLRILSATDCIKDRLAAFFHWDDMQCLKQAVSVAGSNKIDLNEIHRWAVKEGHKGKFEVFKRKLV